MSEKISLARLKKQGEVFEISVDPDLAMRFRKGEPIDIREVLRAEHIFSDAKKGEIAPEDKLEKFFQTADVLKAAETIIRKGEIQVTSEFRSEQREQKRRRIIELIHYRAVDPTTKLPHPITRIENALEEAKVRIDDHLLAEEQLERIITELRPILPLKIEQSELTLTIPPAFAPKAYPLVQKHSKILKESWNPDGSWTVVVELPAGLKPEFIDKLNSFTHGNVRVEE